MTRECHVQFCERLGVKLPGATLPTYVILWVDSIQCNGYENTTNPR